MLFLILGGYSLSLLRLTKAFKEIFFGIILLLLCVFPLEGAAFGELSPKVPQNPFYYLRGDFDKPLLTAQEQAKGAAVARDRFFSPGTEISGIQKTIYCGPLAFTCRGGFTEKMKGPGRKIGLTIFTPGRMSRLFEAWTCLA